MNLINQPKTPEEIAEACERTAELLEGQWQKGEWYSPEYMNMHGQRFPARYCVEGALAAVLGIEPLMSCKGQEVNAFRSCAVYRAVRDTIREQDHSTLDCLANWNDSPNIVEQEVLDVLHATAKRVLGVES